MDFDEAYDYFAWMWETPFRFYHTKKNHLNPLLLHCNTRELKYFALFHDIIYDPYSSTNEEDSVNLFNEYRDQFDDLDEPDLVVDMIMATKTHRKTSDPLIDEAIELDMAVLHSSFDKLLQYEQGIFKEFQKTDINTYIDKRIEFLSKHNGTENLIYYIRNYKYSIGLYAGSFDPFHVGHLDVLHKAEKLFDKVIVVRAVNPDKPGSSRSSIRSYPMKDLSQTYSIKIIISILLLGALETNTILPQR